MYAHHDDRDVELCCFEPEHIQKVIEAIQQNFENWFNKFLDTEGKRKLSKEEFKKMQEKFGIHNPSWNATTDKTSALKRIILLATEDFESDRENYINLLDIETLEEYEDDVDTFKNKALRNECPIIRKTLQNRRAKSLDKYRHAFNTSDATELLTVVTNLSAFCSEYDTDIYNTDQTASIESLQLDVLDTGDYTVYGIIGGGIKSHMLFKVNPAYFSNRSQMALWAMWFLTDKKTFGCKTDSEFLMIDTKKCITQQNYFYPYKLFSYYAYIISILLNKKAIELNAYINPDYRYVIVDAFLDFIADSHIDDISLLTQQIRDEDFYAI